MDTNSAILKQNEHPFYQLIIYYKKSQREYFSYIWFLVLESFISMQMLNFID